MIVRLFLEFFVVFFRVVIFVVILFSLIVMFFGMVRMEIEYCNSGNLCIVLYWFGVLIKFWFWCFGL